MTDVRRAQLDPILSPLRVVEVGPGLAGEIAGKVFAGLGADVVKVELPGGSPSRAVGPFAEGIEDGEHSLHFWYYNVSKRGATIDYREEVGKGRLFRLLEHADMCITTIPLTEAKACALEPSALREASERLIVVSITPFGLTGPRAEWATSDLVALAMGSFLNSCGYSDHSIPPIRSGGDQAYQQAASYAQSGALLALLHREHTGSGQLVDVAVHDTLAVGAELAGPYWLYSRAIVQRQTCRNAAPSPTQPTMFRCADDRWVTFVFQVNNQKMWSAVLDWLKSNELELDLGDPEYLETGYRRQNMAHIQETFEVLFALRTAEEAYHEGQARGLPISPINAPEDVLSDAHLKAREFFVHFDDMDGNAIPFPGAPVGFSSYPSAQVQRPPKLGEHTDEVIRDWTGST